MDRVTPLTPNAVLATDLVILTVRDGALLALLQDRAPSPYQGCCSLPGVLMREDEDDEQAVRRTLLTKVGGADFHAEQVRTFARPDRDPRGRVASVAWAALVPEPAATAACAGGGLLLADVSGGPDGAAVTSGGSAMRLAFDHGDILGHALAWLRGRLGRTLTGAEFLAPEFTLRELQAVYEAVHGRRLTASNFHAYATRPGRGIVPTGGTAPACGPGKPARLYRANPAPAADIPWDTAR